MPDEYPDPAAVEALIDSTPSDGAPPAPAPADAPIPASVLPDPDSIGDDLPYRDAKALREQVTQAKQRYGPIADRFDTMEPDARDRVLSNIDTLAQFADLHPDDLNALNYLARAVQTGDERTIREALTTLSEPFAEAEAEAVDDADADAPMTRSEFERAMSERERENATNQQMVAMHAELRDLGYDPDTTAEHERARVGNVLWLASEFGGDIAKAHQIIEAERQEMIDSYVASKRQDAGRTAAVPVGGSPSTERKIETIPQAAEAAEEFIEAFFNR